MRAEDLADGYGHAGRPPVEAAAKCGVRIYWRNLELVSGLNPYQCWKRFPDWDVKFFYRLRFGTVGRPRCGQGTPIAAIESVFPGTARWLQQPLTEMLALWAPGHWQFGGALQRVNNLMFMQLADLGWRLSAVKSRASNTAGLRDLLQRTTDGYLKGLLIAAHLSTRFAPTWNGGMVPLEDLVADELNVEPFRPELATLIDLLRRRVLDPDAVAMARAVYRELRHRERMMMLPGPVMSSADLERRRLRN